MTFAALISDLNSNLPQTQCQRCGYPDCKAYATAMVQEAAPTNRCPPGEQAGADRLAQLLGRPALPLDATLGRSGVDHTVRIRPELCIGCTLCIAACPVDAIIGAPKRAHQVIGVRCTGCDLCLPPCPVDCFESVVRTHSTWSQDERTASERNYHAHQTRQAAQTDTTQPVAPQPSLAQLMARLR